jgi:hypothetical protein
VAAEVWVPAVGEAAPRVTGAPAEITRADNQFIVQLPGGAAATIRA